MLRYGSSTKYRKSSLQFSRLILLFWVGLLLVGVPSCSRLCCPSILLIDRYSITNLPESRTIFYYNNYIICQTANKNNIHRRPRTLKGRAPESLPCWSKDQKPADVINRVAFVVLLVTNYLNCFSPLAMNSITYSSNRGLTMR